MELNKKFAEADMFAPTDLFADTDAKQPTEEMRKRVWLEIGMVLIGL